ncbi:MAG: hypothetical protein KF881_01210 [Acidobacteria bacterium]|nr:hypothetical protein [Acidobacteriota bacterium]
MSFEITSNNPVVRAVLEGTAPRPAQIAASRGALPLPQADLFELLVHLADASDEELRANAQRALGEQQTADIEASVRSAETAPNVLAYFVKRTDLPASIHESVLANTKTPPAAIAQFAKTTQNGGLLELITLNQQLLIRNPSILDALISNPARTAEADRRAAEIKREFFEKERGAEQIANELRARGHEAAAEFFETSENADEMDVEDALFLAKHIEVLDKETDDSWLALEYIEEIYEESEEQRKAAFEKILGELKLEEEEVPGDRISMLTRVMRMGVKDRVKLGMKGDREARNILIRDPNKLVASAVINNPRITEQEVEMIAAMRTVPEEVLRLIAMNRQWSRSYTVQLGLAKNPRTPLANSMSIMNRLQLRDLTSLTKDRNVPEAVRRHATRLVNARTGNKS